MSDMIDGLYKAALQAGQDAAPQLSARETVAVIDERVRSGRRRRRAVIGAAGTAVLTVGVVSVVALPMLFRGSAPVVTPADEQSGVVSQTGALTVYDDGSMGVVTDAGEELTFPPSEPGQVLPFQAVGNDYACSLDAGAFTAGWNYHAPDAHQLLGSAQANVHYVGHEPQSVAQGSEIFAYEDGYLPAISLNFSADPGIAELLGLRVTQYVTWVGADALSYPQMVRFDSVLDAQPKVVARDSRAGSVVKSREIDQRSYETVCNEGDGSEFSPFWLHRYLVVDVYLMDRKGNESFIASHVSWSRTKVEK